MTTRGFRAELAVRRNDPRGRIVTAVVIQQFWTLPKPKLSI